MRSIPFALAALCLFPVLAGAQTLQQVRVDSPSAPNLALELEAAGFDVIEGSVGRGSLELVVSDASLRLLRARGLEPVLIAVGRPFKEIQAQAQRAAQAAAPESPVPPGYLTLSEIMTELYLKESTYPAIAKVVDLTAKYGTPPTFEGRHIYALKISDNVAQDEDEPNFMMVAEHHAREINTPVVALDAIERFTTQYGIDPTITSLVDAHEIWIAPLWNPDGYEYVFNVNNFWRKNRRVFATATGVDLNRNYPFGWTSGCAGSSSVGSDTYKGPSAGSEAETLTMLAFQADRSFARIIDFHSYGSEVLWGYMCWTHPWAAFLKSEAAALSIAQGYFGKERPPSAHGEEYQDPLAFQGSFAFLTELGTAFQPTYQSAQAEAAKLWPGTIWLLQRPASLSGHVTDSCTGAPVAADISYVGANFTHNEKNSSFMPYGRYHAFLPAGNVTVEFSAPGYVKQSFNVNVTATSAQVLEVSLVSAPLAYCTAKVNSALCLPTIGSTGSPSASAGSGFSISAANVLDNKNGLLFYSKSGANALPFQGGWLCVKSPQTRTAVQSSLGSPPCNGSFSFDFNAWIASGADPGLVAGAQVWAQYWSRDPGFAPPDNTSLTDALQFTICP
jgi:predicted deacylase